MHGSGAPSTHLIYPHESNQHCVSSSPSQGLKSAQTSPRITEVVSSQDLQRWNSRAPSSHLRQGAKRRKSGLHHFLYENIGAQFTFFAFFSTLNSVPTVQILLRSPTHVIGHGRHHLKSCKSSGDVSGASQEFVRGVPRGT